jgi:protein-disulfide isomerase
MPETKWFIPVLLVGLMMTVACSPTEETAESDEPAVSELAGTLNGDPITMDEMNTLIVAELAQMEEQTYQIKTRAVQQLALERMIDAEAASRSIDKDELIRQEVNAKAPTITEAMLRQAYDQNKDRDPTMRGRKYEDVQAYINNELGKQAFNMRRDMFFAELMAKNDLKVTIEPPRADVPIASSDPSKGPQDAPITLVEFADYECGYCRRIQPVLAQLLDEYGDKIHFVYRDYPLSFHPKATPAAIAARCAGDQNKYWEYHDELMTNVTANNLERQDLLDRAAKHSLDVEQFTACIDAETHKELVDSGFEDGKKLGVSGTPTLFVNGRRMVGMQTYAQVKAIVEDELDRLGLSNDTAVSGDTVDETESESGD